MGWIADLLKEIPSAARYKAELEELEAEVVTLRTQNGDLTTRLADAQREIEELRTAAQQKGSARRDDTDEKILLLLTNRQKRTVRDIAAQIGLSEDRTEVILHSLKDAKLVGVSQFAQYYPEPARPSEWYLTIPAGQKYLADASLI